MTEFLLILTLSNNAITTVKLPDKQSCERAGKAYYMYNVGKRDDYRYTTYQCIEVTKSK